jgi:hypothetical protein
MRDQSSWGPLRACRKDRAARSLRVLRFKPPLSTDSCHTAGASCGDGLAEDVVLHISYFSPPSSPHCALLVPLKLYPGVQGYTCRVFSVWIPEAMIRRATADQPLAKTEIKIPISVTTIMTILTRRMPPQAALHTRAISGP